MRNRLIKAILGLVMIALGPASLAQGQTEGTEEDHDQLRGMLSSVRDAINNQDLDAIEPYLYTPFSGTMINQELITSVEEMRAYFDGWMGGEDPFILSMSMAPEADELTQIFQGTIGIARGSNTEVYEIATGREYTLNSRWTATMIKDDDQWKLLAIHNGINFVDNPVLKVAEDAAIYFGVGGAALGLLGGLFFGWFFRLARSRT